MSSHKIHSLSLGPMDNFLYIIQDVKTRECALIDPAWDVDALEKCVQKINGTITAILLTHSHNDHINGLNEILSRHNVPVYLSAQESECWTHSKDEFQTFNDGDTLFLGDTRITALVTPGHSPGSTCFHIGDDLICGDTLFVYGCGRCDLKGSNPSDLFDSLQRLKRDIPPQTVIYTGHNYGVTPTCTMAEQLEGNPFLHLKTKEQFIQYHMIDHGKTRTYPLSPISEDEIDQLYA